MVISKTVDSSYYLRPVIFIKLNGMIVKALIDTGAESIVWVGNPKVLMDLCQPTGSKCSVKGIGGASNMYPVYYGILTICDDSSNDKEKLIVYNRAEIVRTDYSSKNFEIILPYSLFMDFDISLTGKRYNKEFTIDTKVDGKYFFKPKYSDELVVYDISAQLSVDNKFSSLSSLLH